MKKRLDVLLVERGLATSREKAKAMIMAGEVLVDNEREDKAGSMFPEEVEIVLKGKPLPYVSRGGLKLEKAMKNFNLTLDGKVCMDVGASTGGFTDCMLQNGFLEGLRGKGGGYRLTRSPDQYTVEEILMLTEGSLAPVTCLTPGASPCDRLANCRTYEMWKGLNDLISNYFSHITLADLALPDQAGNDYVI